MAQATDYVLANQSGANFRAELNTILAAAVSQNSGSTAPSTTYAYQFWIDTGVTPALLKIRNAANSAWVTVGDVTAANLGLLSAATAASTYAPIASPTFTGTVTIPAGASISGYLTTATAGSTYLPLAGGTLTGDVTINGQGDLRLADLDSSNWVALQAPSSISTNFTLTLPSADGTNGQVLQTNGSGVLSWTSTLSAASPTFTGAIYANGSYRGNLTAVSALDIDCSAGNYFTKTISGNSTFTVSNVPSSRAFAFTLELTHTSGTVTWFSGVEWPAGTAPTLTTGKTHLFMFVTDDGGTRWRASSLINYTN